MTGTRRLIVAIHNVAPATLPECRGLRGIVEEVLGPVPVSLLVVPRYHGDARWTAPARSWLQWREGRGDEIVLHGLDHLDRRGGDGGEFHPGLGAAGIGRRLREAVEALGHQGLEAHGFIAPAYLHPAILDAGCDATGLEWWATRGRLRAPGVVEHLPSLGLGASTAARRVLSPAAARLAATVLAPCAAVRLDLHPADLRHPRLTAAIRPLLIALARQWRIPARHRDLLHPPARAATASRRREVLVRR
ncbi:MAG: DUF2334 domain-containing protein [Thermoleophilia bacterium]